ncbi:hypothetical protein RB195_007488 [Necator americanus]
MSIPTAVIPVVLHLLLLAHSAQTLQVLPYCGNSRALPSYIREPLFVHVDVAKRQNPSMRYSCELEVLALDFLTNRRTNGLTYTEYVRQSVHYETLAREAAQNWYGQLRQMGPKREFGCNLIEKPSGTYRVACLYR